MVVDASVVASHLVPQEAGHDVSRRWVERHIGAGGLVIAPVLRLPEVAGAIARRTGRPELARLAIDALLGLASLRLLAVDETFARAAAAAAARLRLRGADALYIAAAAELRVPLVTWDAEQRDRAAGVVAVLEPGP